MNCYDIFGDVDPQPLIGLTLYRLRRQNSKYALLAWRPVGIRRGYMVVCYYLIYLHTSFGICLPSTTTVCSASDTTFLCDVSIHSTSPSCFTRFFWHDIQTTAAVFYITSSGRSARSSLYSRQAGVSGFWCHRLERPASPRRICAVTRGFQTTTQDLSFFPVPTKTLSYDSCVTITIHHYCLDTCGPCNN